MKLSATKCSGGIIQAGVNAPSFAALEQSFGASDRAACAYLEDLRVRMVAAGLTQVRLEGTVSYGYHDDHEDNKGEMKSVRFAGGELVGVDDDDSGLIFGLHMLSPETILEIGKRIIWPKAGKSRK